MLASTLTTLNGSRSVSGTTISAYLYKKPPLLRNGFLDWISNGQASNHRNATIHAMHANILFLINLA
jgi:hypothetical protein